MTHRLSILLTLASLLVLPLALLLFAQWPLRDWLQAYSRLPVRTPRHPTPSLNN